MPNFLTRLRSLRKPKTTSTPAVKSIESNVFPQYHDVREPDVQEAPDSPDSPRVHTAEVELDSKIYPDLSTLFASVEDALRTVERAVEVKKGGQLSAETENAYECAYQERRRAAWERTRTNELDSTIYASYGSSMGTGGSMFGLEDTPCPPELRKTHIANPLHLHRNHHFNERAISADDRPSSADAVLSWSPKQIFENSDSDSQLLSLGPSSFSGSRSQALLPSPEIQQRDNSTRKNSYYSPSPGTFGFPTPPNNNFIQTDSPNFPPPVFHSTPKTSSTRSRAGGRRRSPRTRHRTVGSTPRVLQNSQAMRGTVPDKIKSPKKTGSISVFGSLESTRIPLRASSSVSRAINRRKSAEWNAHAASAGVVADPRQTTEFGWPAEVSREILRLSLGDELTFNAYNTFATAPVVSAKSEPLHLKRGLPRVSHEYKSTARLIGPSVSEPRPPSAFLYSTTLPQSSSTPSSAPGRSGRQQIAATNPPPEPHASGVAAASAQETARSRESPSEDNALGKRLSDSNMSAAGVPERKRHFENDNSIDWQSAELQEFISREENSKSFASGDVHALHPSTPMKKSESASTYQTAGSSSYLQAPSLSVIAPTPRSSPGNSKHSSGVLPEMGEGLHVPHPPPQTEKSKGKRKAEESEEGSPPDLRGSQGKKTSFAAEVTRRDSDASHAPSSFQSFQTQKSRKRVRLSSPIATPDQSRPGSAAPHHVGSASSRDSSRSNLTPAHFQQPPPDTKGSHHPRPLSRASRASRQTPSGGGSSMAVPGRRSLSQSSIPISAIITPRAPSVSYMSSFHMRDPRRPPPRREVGWTLRFSSADDNGSPFMAWAFWFGFLLPLLWWVASFWRIPQTRMVGTDTEKAVIVDDPFYEREARAWRLRCRVASALFFVTYVPVIVLIAVLA